MGNLTIETAGTKEETEEGLAVSVDMEVEEDRVNKGEEGGGGDAPLGPR